MKVPHNLQMMISIAIFWLLTIASHQINSFPLFNANDLIDLSHFGSEIFGKPSNTSGDRLKSWDPETGENAEEVGEYLEGDILIPKQISRNGLKAEAAHWPDGIIPYEIAGSFSSSEENLISQAMDDYHKMTCLKFVPRSSSDDDYISIVNSNTGCWSSVGRVGGRQEVNLQSPGCLTKKGTVIHELMHAVGFLHEQNRYERDSHVTIKWPNIQKGRENNFQKASKKDTTAYGVPYDYRSVMHYSSKAFSVNGQPTIDVKVGGVTLGQREGFSRHDVTKIRNMYKCS